MTLFGYGKTNQAIARKFAGQCQIFDDKFTEVSEDNFGNALLPPSRFDPTASSLEIVTPGIPPSNPMVLSARNVQSDYDFFSERAPFSIWVSGTNGKTTVTEMIGHLLAHRGAVIGGNVGTPVSELVDKDASIWVLESSSFTLHYTNKAKPNLYVLLPVSEDHITWHGSFEAYKEAKLKPLYMLREGESAIIPEAFKVIPTKGLTVTYANEKDLAEYFGVEIEKVAFEGPFLMDAVIALGVSKILFDEIDYEKINTFVPGEHKMSEFRDSQNRLWVDDSKATNVDATIQALKKYRNKTVYLILGGDDKGADLTPLFESLKELRVTVYVIGSNAEKLQALSNQFEIPCTPCYELGKAVEMIDTTHTEESVALLSPAAASLDQFSSYKARGEKFKEIVLSLR